MEQIVLRDVIPEDINFIRATFLKGTYYGSEWTAAISKDVFFTQYAKVLDNLLLVANIKIACLSDAPDVILGYSIYHQNILHFVFVKKAWRLQGIANKLVPLGITTCTAITKPGNAIRRKKGVDFNPFEL